MASIPAYTKDFETATTGSDGGLLFSEKSGTQISTIIDVAPITGTKSIKFTTTAETITNRENDATPRASVWRLYRIRFVSAEATIQAFLNFYSDTTKIGDLRINATTASSPTLQLRNISAAAFDGTYVLSYGVNYWIALRVAPGASGGLQYKLYSPTGTLLEDSELCTSTTTATTVNNFRYGVFTSGTMSFIMDDFRGDNATELAPPVPAIVANAGADQTNKATNSVVTLTASATGGTGAGYVYTWTQTSGPAVTLGGTAGSATRTFTVPTLGAAATAVFQVSVTDNIGTTPNTDTVSIGMLAATAALTANAGLDQTNIEPYSTVTLSASSTGGSGTVTYAFTRVSGPVVTLSGTGTNRTFTAPAGVASSTIVFSVTATDNVGATSTDTVSISIYPYDRFTRISGVWVPLRDKIRSAGAWVDTLANNVAELFDVDGGEPGSVFSLSSIDGGGPTITYTLNSLDGGTV